MEFPDPLPAGVDDVPTGATDPDMTDPTLDYEGNNTFTLIVTAEDNADSSRTVTAEVNISLINLNEHPYFDKASRDAVEDVVTYSEHRTNAVVPMLAGVEPDGDSLRWELTGTDAGAFEIVDADDIDDGKDRVQLMFKKQPDFETRGGETGEYDVIVRATEMTAVGGGPAMAAELAVKVQVEDFSEDESVSLNWLQPEVETLITATLSDGDDRTDVPTWQWYRAKATEPNRNPNTDTGKLEREWESVGADNGGQTATYTPQEADEDKYLLARAAYNDTPGGTGDENEQAAVGISAYKVREDVSDIDNNSPDFNQSETTRSVPENTAVDMPVGDPVDVDRNEDGDVLTYEIVTETTGTDGNTSVVADDHPFFSIDKATGQVSVAKKLSAEETDERNYTGPDAATAGAYQIVVRATDPSGETTGEENRDDIVVKITATDVDEAPGVTGGMAELSVCEVNSTPAEGATAYVGLGLVAEDCAPVDLDGQDGTDTNNDNLYHRTEEDIVDRATWPAPIAGPDGHLFEYSTPDNGIGRRLHFENPPNYEDPQDANRDNVYEVMIRVVDSDDLVGEKSVRVTVMNVAEDGKLTLAPDQPDDGMPVIATITDPDSPAEYGGVVVTNWMWAASETSGGTFGEAILIDGASMSEYRGNVGEFLWAMVRYRDGKSVMDDPVTALDERNDDPTTTPTEQHRLQDRDAEGNLDDSDQLHHNSDEMKDAGTDRAVQPDPDPPGDGMTPDTGVVMIDRMVYENVPSTGYVGMPIENLMVRNSAGTVLANRHMIGGPDGDTFVFAEDQDGTDSIYYDDVLRGPTVDNADVNDKMGQLALAPVTHLDYESAKNTYTIEITDPDADIEVSVFRITITVADVNERPTAPSELKGLPPALNTDPMFDMASTTMMVAENSAAGTVVGMVMATDADRGDTLTYSLGGDHAMYFDIDDMGNIMVGEGTMLDYESDMMYYMVDVMATDEEGEMATIMVTIMVTNVGLDNMYDMDDSGKIEIGEAITAVQDFFGGRATLTDAIATVQLYFAGLGG